MAKVKEEMLDDYYLSQIQDDIVSLQEAIDDLHMRADSLLNKVESLKRKKGLPSGSLNVRGRQEFME